MIDKDILFTPPPHYPYYPVLHSLRHHVSVDVYRLSVGGGGGVGICCHQKHPLASSSVVAVTAGEHVVLVYRYITSQHKHPHM